MGLLGSTPSFRDPGSFPLVALPSSGAFISSADALHPVSQGEKRRMEESSSTSVWRWQPSRLLALHCWALFSGTHARKKRSWTFGIKYSGIYHIYTPAIWSLVRYKTVCKKCHVSFLHVLLQQTQATHATPSQAGATSGLEKETPGRGGRVSFGAWYLLGSEGQRVHSEVSWSSSITAKLQLSKLCPELLQACGFLMVIITTVMTAWCSPYVTHYPNSLFSPHNPPMVGTVVHAIWLMSKERWGNPLKVTWGGVSGGAGTPGPRGWLQSLCV